MKNYLIELGRAFCSVQRTILRRSSEKILERLRKPFKTKPRALQLVDPHHFPEIIIHFVPCDNIPSNNLVKEFAHRSEQFSSIYAASQMSSSNLYPSLTTDIT